MKLDWKDIVSVFVYTAIRLIVRAIKKRNEGKTKPRIYTKDVDGDGDDDIVIDNR